MTILLASASAARSAMLAAAGVECEAVAPGLDEDPIKAALSEEGASARTIADTLAEAKALKLSRKIPEALVLGADQTLATEEGAVLSKPADRADAKQQLAQLSGKTHSLYSAAVMAERGEPVWRHVEEARLTMRILSTDFIDAYVEREWEEIRHSVGGYLIEGKGAQLMAKIEGSHFAILGLPLLPLLENLRARGTLPA